MSDAPDHLLRSLADDMARQLAGAGGAEAVLLLERFGLLSPMDRPPERPPAALADPRPGRVGIWEAGPNGHERSPALCHEWPFWADVETIPPKGEAKRIVLLGESVAVGFLYAPAFTPAMALAAAATAALGEPVEVVDLAKSGIKARELAELAGRAPELAPDGLVVFAGNNWYVEDRQARHLEAAALRAEGARGLQALRDRRLAEWIDGFLGELAGIAERVPVVLVVPEINLADWRLDGEADPPWLPAGGNRRWLERRTAARAALAAGRRAEAAALAREMIAIDGGTAASGWTLLAACARAEGDLDAARERLERARDARTWDHTYQVPRAISLTQEALRRGGVSGHIAVVDLPHRFAEWRPGELPGRGLFLDYCHLTAEGIRVAMAATALEIAPRLGAGQPLPDLARLVDAIAPPSDETEATAHFAAALHSAHWGQPRPFVSYLCGEAARRSPAVAEAMRAYLELQTRRAPAWACAAVERLAAAPPFLRDYVLQNPAKLFDPVLLPAIAEALDETAGRGEGSERSDGSDASERSDGSERSEKSEGSESGARAFLAELRLERSLSERPRDLLDPYHRASWADVDWLEWPSHVRRAYSPTSRYPWVSRAPREVAFTLTCRRSGAAGAAAPAECRARVNGAPVATFAVGLDWSTLRFSAPAERVERGVNWLEIDWPLDLPDGEAAIEHAAREHESGRAVPLLPVFAEIASLHAAER